MKDLAFQNKLDLGMDSKKLLVAFGNQATVANYNNVQFPKLYGCLYIFDSLLV